MSRTVNGPIFVSRYEVVEGMAARVMSEIRDNPESDWASASGRIKREFARESATLYQRAQCAAPDGADLIAEAAERQAPQIRVIAVENMKTALVSAVENSPRGMALWSSVKEYILRENNLAIGISRGLPLPSSDGSDLIGEALDGVADRVRVEVKTDVVDGRPVEYLVKAQPEPCRTVKPPPPIEEDEEKDERDVWPPPILRSLTWVHIIVGIIAALLALIGVTIWDIIPIPCDLWPFSLYSIPRCP